jgi:hypothetical protein
MAQSKHKYRVNVYLGKKIYARIEEQAKVFNMPIATLTKLLIETGFAFADQLEKLEKGGNTNGK